MDYYVKKSILNLRISIGSADVSLHKKNLYLTLGEGGVEVEHMVAAVIVMVASAVVGALAPIPNVGKVGHGGGLPAVDLFQEAGINRAAVPAHAVMVEVEASASRLSWLAMMLARLRGVCGV